MTAKKETFASLLDTFGYKHDISRVFDDFLTMALCAFSQNPRTKKSYDEDLYLETIGRYKHDECRHLFPKMLACLTMEMEDRLSDNLGNDVLGGYYELHLYKKRSSQYFTPWPICMFMAKSLTGNDHTDENKVLRILDPSCGSGRMLLAGARTFGRRHSFYGIDIDHTCVKMAAINLFLHGMFHAEVMCADALSPDNFQVSYRTSFLPFGVFRITEKEKSPLWHQYKNSFPSQQAKQKATVSDIVLPSKDGDNLFKPGASQLKLF